MISALVDLLEQEMNGLTRQLAEYRLERQRFAEERVYWQEILSGQGMLNHSTGDGIAASLRYGAKADREMKSLEEKDFLVETRIKECREMLLSLAQRRKTLEKLWERRQKAAQLKAARRQERDMMQRDAARRAVREAHEEHWD